MVIGFQPNPEVTDEVVEKITNSGDATAVAVPTKEKPAKKSAKKAVESVNPPRPDSLNVAFYFLNVDFLPRTARLSEPGVGEHIMRELNFAYPLCVLAGGPEGVRITTPVKNDSWAVIEPIIRDLEDKHELEVLRFNTETLVPQPDPTPQQIAAQRQQAALAAQQGAGLLR